MNQEEQIRKRIMVELAQTRDDASRRMENAESDFNAYREKYNQATEAFDLAENDFVALIEKNTGAM